MLKKIILIAIALAVGGFLLIQLVPYGRDHSNPPVVQEPNWDSPATRELAVRACFDCHSNETVWPWYSNIAPVSWRLQRHVEEGRSKLNLSEWGVARPKGGEGEEREGEEGERGEGRGENEGDEAGELIRSGEMPPFDFLWMHPAARLTGAEKTALIAGLAASGVSGD